MSFDRRSYQQAGVTAILDEHRRADRALVTMACASGKTAVQAFLIEDRIRAGDTRFYSYAPSIDLIYQTARTYRRHFGDQIPIYAVCSEKEREEGGEGPASVTTTVGSAEEIRHLMATTPGPAIFLPTYDSAQKMSEAQRLPDGTRQAADLGLFDEAHNVAGGTPASRSAHALFDENTLIRKRAFFTATPRITAEGRVSSQQISMSDTRLFGRRVFDFSYTQAREAGVVADYEIWVPIVTRDELDAFLAGRGLDQRQTRNAIGEIAMRQVMEETGQSRGVTFHNSIAASRDFARQMGESLAGSGTAVEHVDGKTMNRRERQEKLSILEGEGGIVTNSRVLGEGVNLPSLQMAAFIEPSRSVLRTVQGLSRVLRKDQLRDPDKVASLIVPIMVEERSRDGVLEAARAQGFADLISIATALQHTDNTFDADIRRKSMLIGRGEGEGLKLSKLRVTGLDMSPEERAQLSDAIAITTMREIAHPFSHRVGEVQAFIETHGRLPEPEDNPKLAAWMRNTRDMHREGRLHSEDARMLDRTPGWRWVPERARAATIAQHLTSYAARRREPPPFDLETGHRTGEAELADFIFDSERARADDTRTPARSPMSDSVAGKLATLLREHTEKAADSPLARQAARTAAPFHKGRLEIRRNPDGLEEIHFQPLAYRRPFFDTGIETNWKKEAPHGFRLVDLGTEARRDLAALAAGGKAVELKIGPVRRNDGSYSRDTAVLLEMSKTQTRRVVTRPAPAPGREIEAAFSLFPEPAGPTQPAQQGASVSERKFEAPAIESRATWGRFAQFRHPRGAVETRFFPVNGDASGIAIERPDEARQDLIDRLPRSPHAIRAHLRLAVADKGKGAGDTAASLAGIDLGEIRRDNEPDRITRLHILHRLEDRHAAGLVPYSRKYFAQGLIDPGEAVTSLTPGAVPLKAQRLRACLDQIQAEHATGRSKIENDRLFDRAPGFSWVETDRLEGRLAPAVRRIAERHGVEVLSSNQAREGDNGLANTLRVVDHVMAHEARYPGARAELAQLSRDKTITHFVAAARLRVEKDTRNRTPAQRREDDPRSI